MVRRQGCELQSGVGRLRSQAAKHRALRAWVREGAELEGDSHSPAYWASPDSPSQFRGFSFLSRLLQWPLVL